MSIELILKGLNEDLDERPHFHNWACARGGLTGKAPMDKYIELILKIPLEEEVGQTYAPSREG